MGPVIRRFALIAFFLVLLTAWAGAAAAYFLSDSVAVFTIALTIAALATEAFIWCLALIGGWSIFANRKRLWRRLTGRGAETLGAGLVFLVVFGAAALQMDADKAELVSRGELASHPAIEKHEA